MKKIINCFLQHPKDVGETYVEHFFVASKGALFLLKVSIVLFLHAFFPFLFKTYASENVNAFAEKFMKRKLFAEQQPEASEPGLNELNELP